MHSDLSDETPRHAPDLRKINEHVDKSHKLATGRKRIPKFMTRNSL